MVEPLHNPYAYGIPLAYIGKKKEWRDTIARTGCVWHGFGDVQTVDAKAAGQLLRFKEIFVRADELERIKADLEKQLDEPELVVEPDELPAMTPREQEAGVDVELKSKILDALNQMDPANPDHFTTGGKPRVSVVESIIGVDVSAEQVAAVFVESGA
jgi:hypothetical protein